MKEIRKILFPVDLSDVSPKIVPNVMSVAEKFGAEIHLLHVAIDFDDHAGLFGPHPGLADVQEDILRRSREQLDEFHQTHFKEYPRILKAIQCGDPVEKILEYVASEGIDLVIMGTHGRKGLDKVLFGSVADQVVKNSPVPVMSVNPYRTL
ncbi:MAG TPA: universal stress protein [Syntrophobacteraceae bacterium]|nr:universal stress protein [Syntrophobacteraceae bacterium]